MNLFGVAIDIVNNYSRVISPVDEIVAGVIKKNEERKIFQGFLESGLTTGECMIDSLTRGAFLEADELAGGNVEIEEKELVDFVIEELKKLTDGSLNLYEGLKRKIIETEKPEFARLHRLVDSGKFDGRLPFGYPDASKKADGLIIADIRDSLNGKIIRQVLEKRILISKIRKLGGEMFLAINKLNLRGEYVTRYLRIIYELSQLEEAPAVQSQDLKKTIADSLRGEKIINLVHVKCARFVYPQKGGVVILTNTDDVVIDGVNGRYAPKSEKELFARLRHIRDILTTNGARVDFSILIADEDIELLYPAGNPLVAEDQKAKAYEDLDGYIGFLRENFGGEFVFETISNLALQMGEDYFQYRQEIFDDIRRFGGRFVEPHFFDRDRVNHQFEYYQRLFGKKYTRDEARRSISAQTASYIALEKLLPRLGKNIVLIEENRGGENNLIANGRVPIIFIKLRDEAKFDVE